MEKISAGRYMKSGGEVPKAPRKWSSDDTGAVIGVTIIVLVLVGFFAGVVAAANYSRAKRHGVSFSEAWTVTRTHYLVHYTCSNCDAYVYVSVPKGTAIEDHVWQRACGSCGVVNSRKGGE